MANARRSSSPQPTAERSRSPAISCGIYGYPPELAAPVAVGVLDEFEQDFEFVRFVFLDEALRNVFAAARE